MVTGMSLIVMVHVQFDCLVTVYFGCAPLQRFVNVSRRARH